MKAAFYTLGCKVNQYETQIMEQAFSKAGFEIVDSESTADVYVINSCTVTGTGDKKSRQMVRHFRRKNPNAVIALTGCYPQAFPDDASLLLEADVITGSADRSQVLPAVFDALDDIGYKGVYNFELVQKMGVMTDEFLAFSGKYLREFIERRGNMK